jgi:DNA-binding NarL/FixJ family response regulator
MIRLLLVEDHAVLRSSFAVVLERQPDFVVTAQSGTLAEAREHLPDVDLVLLDLDLPDGDGLSLIPKMHAANPKAAALVLTASPDPADYARAIEQGAAGVVHKAASIEEIVDAIRRTHDGKPIHSREEMLAFLRLIARQRAKEADTQRLLRQLTPREHDLLQGLAHGLSDREIADQLNVSVRTVQSHMMNLMEKLGVHSRLNALITALRHDLVEINQD